MSAPVHITSPAVRNVLIGRYAECSIGGVVLVFLFDWEINITSELTNLTACGDRWRVFVPIDSEWNARARGYIAPSAGTSYISGAYTSLAATGGAAQLLTFAGYTAVTGGQQIWAGTCYITSGRLAAPMGLFEQEISLRGTANPTAGVPG